MNYNDGQVHSNPDKENKAKQYEMARDFAEGNSKLERLLLKLWENGISTSACCNGHKGQGSSEFVLDENGAIKTDENNIPIIEEGPELWYITINIDENNLSFIDELTKLVKEKGFLDNMLCYEFKYDEKGFTICIRSTINSRDIMLDEINKCIDIAKNKEKNTITNEVFYSALKMKKDAEKDDLNLQFHYYPNSEKTGDDEVIFTYYTRVIWPIKRIPHPKNVYEERLNELAKYNNWQKKPVIAPILGLSKTKPIKDIINDNGFYMEQFYSGTIEDLIEYVKTIGPYQFQKKETRNNTQLEQSPINKENHEKIKKAAEYAEGNTILEKLLLKLWDKGIDTYSCCNGHGEQPWNIAFKVTNENMDIISKLYKFVENNNLNDDFLNITYQLINDEKYVSLTSNNKNRDLILNYISKSVDESKLPKHHSILVGSNLLAHFSELTKYKFRVFVNYNSNNITFNMYTPNSITRNSNISDIIIDQAIEDAKKMKIHFNKVHHCSKEEFIQYIRNLVSRTKDYKNILKDNDNNPNRI